jgi:dihydrodipicolinate synthase/N-acetylneuraminate lyase
MASYDKKGAQDWAWENLKGQWTTLMTPFGIDDKLDEQGLRENIKHIRSLGTRGGGCTWGMGEFWSLELEERFNVMEILSNEAKGSWLTAAHVTHTSYKDMIKLAKYAEKIDIDLLIVAAPYFAAKTEEQVIEYTELLANNTNLAIMFYNSPQFGFVMSPEGLKKICKPRNVVGVKEASFNQQISIDTHMLIGKEKIISTPDEWIYFKQEELGFRQQVMFANTSDWRFDTIEHNYYVQFIEKASDGFIDKKLYDTYIKAVKEVSDKWWPRTVQKFGGVLPVTLCKYWSELMGMAAGDPRPPLKPFSNDEKLELEQDLLAIGHPIKQIAGA